MAKLIKSTSALTACFSLSLLALFAIAFFSAVYLLPFLWMKTSLDIIFKARQLQSPCNNYPQCFTGRGKSSLTYILKP